MTTKNEPCGACGRLPDEHEGMRHPYSPKGSSSDWLKPKKVTPPRVDVSGQRVPASKLFESQPIPFDPVLRQALINKGVITPDDLASAEQTIRALGLGGALGGQSESEEPAPGQ